MPDLNLSTTGNFLLKEYFMIRASRKYKLKKKKSFLGSYFWIFFLNFEEDMLRNYEMTKSWCEGREEEKGWLSGPQSLYSWKLRIIFWLACRIDSN